MENAFSENRKWYQWYDSTWDFPGIQAEIWSWAYGDAWYWPVDDYTEVCKEHTEKARTRGQTFSLWTFTH